MKTRIKLSLTGILLLSMAISCGDSAESGNPPDEEGVSDAEAAFETIQECAENGDASSVTIELLATAGVTGLVESNLADYQAAIAAAGYISDLAELQAIIDSVNSANSSNEIAKWGSAVWGKSKWNP